MLGNGQREEMHSRKKNNISKDLGGNNICVEIEEVQWLEQSKKDTRGKVRGSQGPEPSTLFSIVSPSLSKLGGWTKKMRKGTRVHQEENSRAHFSEFFLWVRS